MKKSKFTEEQIVGILRETDRDSVATEAKRHGVSDQAIYTWKKRFGSYQPDDVRRLKQLEPENAPLKKLVAERDLEIEVMKEIAAKNGRRAGPSRAGGVCRAPRPVATTVSHAAGRGPFGSGLPIDEGREGCACAGAHGDTGRAVPALRDRAP
jgi:putative transposase